MIIEPGFFTHWKTRALRAAAGPGAAESLMMLWAHCQERRRWEFQLTPAMLAGICSFPGEPKAFWDALIEFRWIEEAEPGWYRVRDWDVVNKSLIQKWGARKAKVDPAFEWPSRGTESSGKSNDTSIDQSSDTSIDRSNDRSIDASTRLDQTRSDQSRLDQNKTPLPPEGEKKVDKSEPDPEPPPPGPQAWKPTPEQQRINSWYNRRDQTAWSEKEIRAFRKLPETSPEEWDMLEEYCLYAKFSRKDISTLLNNWAGEIDRARNWSPDEDQPQQQTSRPMRGIDYMSPQPPGSPL